MTEIDNPRLEDIPRDAKGRWLPGQSAHPGQPKGTVSLVALLRKQLAEHPEDAKDIIKALVTLGKGYEIKAIREIMDRIDGKVVETHKIEGELPIKLVFVPAKELLAANKEEQA